MPEELSLLFVNEPPFIIAYERKSRIIARVLYARQDVPTALGQPQDGG